MQRNIRALGWIMALAGTLFLGTTVWGRGESDAQALAQASNQFGCDVYQRLTDKPGNLFISPHSIHAALSMTLLGAGSPSSTAAQMAKTLHLAKESPVGMAGDLHWFVRPQTYSLLLTGTPNLKGINARSDDKHRPYELISVNALWGQKGHPFQPEYLKTVRETFQGDLRDTDFIANPDAARQTINAWVQQQTKDKIKDLLAPDNVTRDTRLVLTNAIYFKSAWLHAFEKSATSDQPFTLADGKTVKVPMMRKTERFEYARRNNFDIIGLPYQMGELSMLILLPHKADGLPALEKSLSAELLQEARRNLPHKRLDLSLPRFKFEARYDLNDTLKALGMTDAFTPGKADFSGIDGSRELAISCVIHKAFVDVNEEGTEAAAATAVGIMRMSIETDEPEVVKVDRPFVFAIVHHATGTVLFLGRVSDPRN